jgi:hypothetical protein
MEAEAVRRGARTAWVRRRHGGHGSFNGGEMVEENGMLLPRPGKRRKGGEGLDDAATGEGLEVVVLHGATSAGGGVRASGAVQTRQQRGAGEQAAWTGRARDTLPVSAWARVATRRVGWLQAGCFGPAQNEYNDFFISSNIFL